MSMISKDCTPKHSNKQVIPDDGEFNLNHHNGIKDIKVIEDNSYHYLCYLDDGWREER